MISVSECSRRIHVNPTSTIPFTHPYLEIASITPTSSPRVSHQEIFLSLFRPKANHNHSMVKIRPTITTSNYTTSVVHQNRIVRINSYSDRSLCKGCLDLPRIVLLNILVVSHIHRSSLKLRLTVASVSSVWVG